MIGGGYIKELNENIWPQVVGYVLERRSGEPAKRQAMAIFRDMTRQWPKKKWESTQPKECSHEVRNKIRSLQIAFANRRASQ